jgi:hypothetical protein
MKPYQANLINALCLIALGLWGYFSEGTANGSPTALIAPGFGVVLLALSPGLQRENKAIAHAAVLLTFLLLVMLLGMPLPKRIQEGDTPGTIRVVLMAATCTLAMVAFIRSFIAARKARKSA